MYTRLFLLGIAAVILSCKKENYNLDEKKSSTELLTQYSWMLASYGYDYNRNGLIDANEESIPDCEKDNGYSFNTDGTGLYEDNSLSCGNGISELSFNWKFTDGNTTLDFLFSAVKISRLDDKQLIIYHDAADAGGQSIRYIQIFRH